MSELLYKPAGELARLVRAGDVSARELVEASLERIEALQPELNAFCHLDPDGALAIADAVERDDPRPFAGVPIAIKDTAPVNGMPLSMGSDLFGDFIAPHDAFLVRRLRDAGFVIVGRTNMPEFGILPVTEPRRYGPTRNPWDTGRTPGGSSGGAAAAVAGGMVPLAHGSDGGGSIRIPAACCGLVGLKPSRGRISRGPEQGDDFLVQDGVLTRTVAETAELLDVLAGYEPGDATWAPSPPEPFATVAGRDPGRLRIGLTLEPPIEAALDPICERAVRAAADLLSSFGHEVVEVDAPWAGQDLLQVFTLVFGTPVGLAMVFGGLVSGREPNEDLVEPLSWTMWTGLEERSPVDYLLARTQLTAYARAVVSLWDNYDAVLTPALAERPVPIGEIDACSEEPWEDFRRSGRFTPYTAIFNITGQPAISLPLVHGDDGLPAAVQIAGRPADEGTLLRLGAQLESARSWADRRPEPAVA
jgi:amidase